MTDHQAQTLNDSEFDQQHIWHPYSSITKPLPTFHVSHCQGTTIFLQDGRKLIDGMASWWSAIHGYNHPQLNQAINTQLESMSHIMFGGLTHSPAIELARLLIDITPQTLTKVFFSDSGSVAVEVAIKMAMQYWQAKGQTRKTRLLSLRNGYHGDTFATMAVSDPVNGMHHLFSDTLIPHIFAPQPSTDFNDVVDAREIEVLRKLFIQHHHQLAAFILEPIVQGAGGMNFYSPDYLRAIRHLCDEYEVLLIADEIATGFGRTGKLFACEHANISADILCLGKALTGGYLTLAATLCSDEVANGIGESEAGVFMHGPTFMANPLACAAACASIKLLANSDWQGNIQRIARILTEGFDSAKNITGVADVRVLGGIGVIELTQTIDIKTLQPAFVEAGVWLRPFGKLVYVMPSYIISDADLKKLCSTTTDVLESYLSVQALL